MTVNADDATADTRHGTGRHRARRVALEVLYRSDVNSDDPMVILGGLREANPDLPPYAGTVIEAVVEGADVIDALITSHLRDDWPLDRLGPVERAILRIGMVEIEGNEVPDEVAVDEAVILAKAYASAAAARLINGVLGARIREKQADQP